MIGSKIFLYVISSIPSDKGKLTLWKTPLPAPISLTWPVPGKKSLYLWKLQVNTLSELKKASSTPSPWCTSISRYNTQGKVLSISNIANTQSLT